MPCVPDKERLGRCMRFPLFVDIQGKKAVIVGFGKIGMRRALVLRDFGARVTVISESISDKLDGIEFVCRKYASGDIKDADIVVAATNKRDVNQIVGKEARENKIPVSVADSAQESTFFFPAICKGNGIVAGVVSDGTEHHKTARAAHEIRKVLSDEKKVF